jgi:hypothetical protein
MMPAIVHAAPAAAVAAAQSPEPAPPQARSASNVIFAEVLGSGLLYSLNYERLFASLHLGLRAGASFFTYSVSTYGRSGNLVLASFPLVASYYFSWRAHNLQLGLGATLLYSDAGSDSKGTQFETDRSGLGVAASAVVGYRYLPLRRGITFGAAFTPLLRAGAFLPWGGANVGYVF